MRLKRTRALRLLAVTVLAASASFGPTVASAGAATPADASCAYGASSMTPDNPHPSVKKDCFSTFAEALNFATHGRVRLPATATTVSDNQLEQSGAVSTSPNSTLTNPLLGIEYFNHSYTGSSDVYYGTSGSGCYSGTTYGFSTVTHDNAYHSSKGYSNCGGDHYQDPNYQNADLQCSPNCTTLGILDGRTSSIVYR